MKRLIAWLLTAIAASMAVPAAATEVHGSTDVFKRDGIAMAWAVARGADETRTLVVVRMRLGPGVEAVAVTGRDPFTKAEKVLQRVPVVNGRVEVRLPRGGFADFPRTDWQFSGTAKDLPLTVFYLGIPDTTPEFADEARLGSYLEGRLGK
jgi:hypothetical protein